MRLRAAARSAADIDKIPLPARASSRLAKRLSRSAGISSAVASSTHPVTNGLSAARSLWIAILTCAGVIGLEPIAFFDVRWSEISFSVSSRIRSASVLGCCTRNSSAFCFIGSVTEICRSRSGSKPRRSRRAAGLNLQTLRLIRSMRRNGPGAFDRGTARLLPALLRTETRKRGRKNPLVGWPAYPRLGSLSGSCWTKSQYRPVAFFHECMNVIGP